MSHGRWDTAIIKSILSVGAVTACVIAFHFGFSLTIVGLHGLLSFLGLFSLAYLFVSVMGWLLIGLPIHWMICNYTKGSYLTYIATALVVCAFMTMLLGIDSMVFFGSVILLQVVIFRYYVTSKA
jgi:inner membrane protein involved in colicin E2 resistance